MTGDHHGCVADTATLLLTATDEILGTHNPMLPTEDLFACVYVLIHDLITAGTIAIPARPGLEPACSDAELLAIAVVRHLLGRRSEAGFLAEVARDWAHLFPRLPHQSEANRRIRWLRGAFEQFREALAATWPVDNCQQTGTSAIPVKHTSRVRGPDGWTGPGNDLSARFGRDAAHAEWSCGFRLPRYRLCRRPGQPRHRSAHPAQQTPARGHASHPAEDHRGVAQPGRDHLQRDHRPDGTSATRRAHLLGPAHPVRRDHRRPYPHAPLPGPAIRQPT